MPAKDLIQLSHVDETHTIIKMYILLIKKRYSIK